MSLKKPSISCLGWPHSSSFRRMIPPMVVKLPLLTIVVFWFLAVTLAVWFFTARTSRSLESFEQSAESHWNSNPDLCRNPLHTTLKNETDYNDLTGPSSQIRIGKATALYGDPNPIYERALRTHELHNRIHGLRQLTLRQYLLPGRGIWNKPTYIFSLLADELRKPASEQLHWILWVDGDTIVLNPCIPPTKFLPPPTIDSSDASADDAIHIVAAKDSNGLNDGVFLLRIHPWTLELFSRVLAFPHFRPSIPLTFDSQSALEQLLEENDEAKRHVAWVPQRWFNAYHTYPNESVTGSLQPDRIRRGSFLVHFAGRGERAKEMEYWLEVTERHAPDWELDYWRTSYPDEVAEFWREWERQRGE